MKEYGQRDEGCMKLTFDELTELKKIELEMLAAFVSVCSQLKLRYYLIHGTLLGAVRHQGFIPWDDDIDVGLFRSDYEVFLKEGQRLLPSELFVQTMETDPECLLWFAKIRHKNTTYIEKTMQDRKMCHGVFIDVFPLDYFPEKPFKQAWVDFNRKWITRRISCEYVLPDSNSFSRKIKVAILKLLMPSIKNVLKKRDHIFLRTRNSNLIVNYGGGKKEIVPVEWFGDGTMLEFEGAFYNVPREYDRWLTQIYGNYFELPPPEERIGHHYVEIMDLKKSFTEYME